MDLNVAFLHSMYSFTNLIGGIQMFPFDYTFTTLMERTYMMKEGQNAESTRWFVVYAGKKMYQNKPAAAGCFTNPYGNISLICVIGTCT